MLYQCKFWVSQWLTLRQGENFSLTLGRATAWGYLDLCQLNFQHKSKQLRKALRCLGMGLRSSTSGPFPCSPPAHQQFCLLPTPPAPKCLTHSFRLPVFCISPRTLHWPDWCNPTQLGLDPACTSRLKRLPCSCADTKIIYASFVMMLQLHLTIVS